MNFRKAWPFYSAQFVAVSAFSITNLVMPVLMISYCGLNAAEIGLILAISSIIRAFLSPLLGAFADIIQKPRLIMSTAVAVTALTLIFLFPAIDDVWSGTIAYILFFAGAGLYMPLIDRASNEFAAKTDVSYGKIRIFGSLGYTFFGVVMPIAMNLGYDVAILIVSGIFALGVIPIALFMKFDPIEPSEHAFMQQLKILLKDFKIFIPILAYVLLVPAASNVQYFYLGNVMTYYGALMLISLTVLLTSLMVECPAFLSYRKFSHKFGSVNLIKFILGLTIARFAILIFFHGPIAYALTLMLHGLTFAFGWNFTLDYIIDNVSPYLRTTVMTIMGSLMMILGGISQGVSSVLLSSSMPGTAFVWFLAIALIATVLYMYMFKKHPEMFKR